ncbi:hypothetical protein E2C01_023737 [Portunus trituberculatus]|uniref:Uncharacterized protein n=1 Tax=Portunus trituberculatus TaxID=210409 RepID=A0A5B7E8Q4_PORTR|nr:hypothetical protein [Portunus trituberculatus]
MCWSRCLSTCSRYNCCDYGACICIVVIAAANDYEYGERQAVTMVPPHAFRPFLPVTTLRLFHGIKAECHGFLVNVTLRGTEHNLHEQ